MARRGEGEPAGWKGKGGGPKSVSARGSVTADKRMHQLTKEVRSGCCGTAAFGGPVHRGGFPRTPSQGQHLLGDFNETSAPVHCMSIKLFIRATTSSATTHLILTLNIFISH